MRVSDSDSDVRREAAKALGKIGDSRSVEPLINASTTMKVGSADGCDPPF